MYRHLDTSPGSARRARRRAIGLCTWLAAAALLAMGWPAAALRAQVTTYTSYASWLAALSGASVGTDSYDDLTDTLDVVSPFIRTTAGTAYAYRMTAYYGRDRRFASWGGPTDFWVYGQNALAPVTFDTFSPAVYAIGGTFFATNAAGVPLSKDVRIYWGAGSSADSATFSGATPQFFGIISTAPVDSLTGVLRNPGTDFLTGESLLNVNDLQLANAPSATVPEPATTALTAVGLGALGVARRRRSRRGHQPRGETPGA